MMLKADCLELEKMDLELAFERLATTQFLCVYVRWLPGIFEAIGVL